MRALIYVHFDRDGIVDPHVEYALAQYRPYVDHLVFVSPSVKELSPTQRVLVDSFVPRENIGYDFGSWRDGLQSLDTDRYEEIIFANDSVYGPLWSPGPVLEFGRERDLDFWGMVKSDQSISGGVPCPHIQSWFFAARTRLIQSDPFQNFWQGIKPVGTKREIIQKFEIGLTESVHRGGFSMGAVYDKKTSMLDRVKTAMREASLAELSRTWRLLRRSLWQNRNPSEGDWDTLLASGVPFVKVSLLRLNPYGRKLHRITERLYTEKSFDVEMINRHLSRIG
ncbi:MAG: rhamnan synthesis F family protein [Pirellula sp.]|jgi:rhamnosyltransferase